MRTWFDIRENVGGVSGDSAMRETSRRDFLAVAPISHVTRYIEWAFGNEEITAVSVTTVPSYPYRA